MFLLCHVFAGMVLGIALARPPRIPPAVLIAVAGSLFADLLDKPMALLLTDPASIFRTFGHTLLAWILVLAVVTALSLYSRDGLVFLFPAAMLLHQVMDLPWRDTVTWLYPLRGPLVDCHCGGEGYVGIQSAAEVTSLSEWIFFAAILLLSALIFQEWITAWTGWDPAPVARRIFPWVIILLAATGVVAAIAGILGLPTAFLAGMVDPAGDLMLAAVSLAGAALLLIHRDRIGAGSEGPGGIPPSRP
ncbi:MAG: metal-dependent hydrolase [Methanomicrobiales archaeon]|nr:metal-dependent hydrolase [Methanomicrobiales archaeon]MDD1654140.1 metal-dependent hydrolase [Methanomicrobiales archaeon]